MGCRRHQSAINFRGKTFFRCLFLSQLKFSRIYLQPSLSPESTSDGANTSQREIHDTRSGAQSQGNWVHVAVAAEAHVRATHAAGVGGQRITAKSGPFFYQDLRKSYITFLFHTGKLTRKNKS